jgi:aspartyl protease family protein
VQDRRDWDDELPYEESADSGLLSGTLRNAAILLGLCLVVAWVMSGAEETLTVPGSVVTRAVPADQTAPQDNVREYDQPEEEATQQAQALYRRGDDVLVRPGPQGHFMVDVGVNGIAVQFMVDTGATRVTLTEEDARRVGLPVGALDYSDRYETANGPIHAAPVTLRDMRIDGFEIAEVDATVTQGPLGVSLLGMSFLNRLSGYEVGPQGLVLKFPE